MSPHATITLGGTKPNRSLTIDISTCLANAYSDTYILSLAKHGWHNCSVADYIAIYYSERNSGVADLLSLLHNEHDKRFDCLVNADEVKSYVSQKRTRLIPLLNPVEVSQGRPPCPEPECICRLCGISIKDKSKATPYKGYYYCARCIRDCFASCDRCGGSVLADSLRSLADKKGRWCEVCLEDNAVCCGNCEQWFADDNVTYVKDIDANYCDSCRESKDIKFCYRCGDYFASTYVPSDCDNRNYCPHCAETVLYWCEDCETYTIAPLEEYGGRHVCEACLESLEEAAEEE